MIFLNANESQYGPSPKAIEAMQAAESSVYAYPEGFAMPLKQKLADRFGLAPENVMAANGSSTILDIAARAFAGNGAECVFCAPTFLYGLVVSMAGGKAVSLPLTKDLKFDLAAMLAAVNENTRLAAICNPNNPTGTYLSFDELEAFIKAVPSGVTVLVDEAYIDFAEAEDCRSVYSLVNDYNVIVTRTFSKLYALAGIRVGYALSSAENIKKMSGFLLPFNTNRAGIAAAVAALDDEAFYADVRARTIEGRHMMTRELRARGWTVPDSQGSFLFVKPPAGQDADQISRRLAEQGILIARQPGDITRISIGTDEQNRAVLAALED